MISKSPVASRIRRVGWRWCFFWADNMLVFLFRSSPVLDKVINGWGKNEEKVVKCEQKEMSCQFLESQLKGSWIDAEGRHCGHHRRLIQNSNFFFFSEPSHWWSMFANGNKRTILRSMDVRNSIDSLWTVCLWPSLATYIYILWKGISLFICQTFVINSLNVHILIFFFSFYSHSNA